MVSREFCVQEISVGRKCQWAGIPAQKIFSVQDFLLSMNGLLSLFSLSLEKKSFVGCSLKDSGYCKAIF